MKKWFVALTTVFIMGLIAACGTSTTSDNLTIEDIFTNAQESGEDLNSASFTLDFTQKMDIPGEGTMGTNMKSEGEVVVDPMATHQTLQMDMDLGFLNESIELEIYVTDQGTFIYEKESDQWMSDDSGFIDVDDILDQQTQPDLSEQLSDLEALVDQFELDETDDAYLLRLSIDGNDEFNDLINEAIEDALPNDMLSELGVSNADELYTINSIEYEFAIEKDTFLIKEFVLDMDMEINIEGVTVALIQTMNMSLDNINEIDSIEIPQEVIDSAI